MPDAAYRLSYTGCRSLLLQRLEEPAPSRIQLLTGPRQVGKTTLLLDLAERLAGAAIYAAGDSPEAALPGFWERLWKTVADIARAQGKAVLLLDEAPHLPHWASALKSEWDRLRRRRLPVHVVATGSSALRIGAASRESLAGRFERVTLSHWSASAVSEAFGLTPEEAAEVIVRFGSYPGALPLRQDASRFSAYLRDSIVEPAIGRDILQLSDVRRPALLRQVFAIATASPARILSLQKIQAQLQDAGALETIAHYLELLEEAYLVAALQKHSTEITRRRSAPPKLVTLNNALLVAGDPEGAPQRTSDPERFGAWVENACLAFAWNAGQRVAYWREEPLEVDAVVQGNWGAWAIEVKTGALESRHILGLAEFSRRHPRFRPLVVCDEGALESASRLGIPAMSWKAFLISGPPGAASTV